MATDIFHVGATLARQPLELPQEIVDHIIDLIATDPLVHYSDLRSCSRISRSWRYRSQLYLFRILSQTLGHRRAGDVGRPTVESEWDEEFMIPGIEKTFNVQSSPRLSRLVQSLHLNARDDHEDSANILHSLSFPNLTQLYLDRFNFSFPQITSPRLTLSPRLSACKSLTKFIINRAMFMDIRQLLDILVSPCLSSVRCLRLHDLFFESSHFIYQNSNPQQLSPAEWYLCQWLESRKRSNPSLVLTNYLKIEELEIGWSEWAAFTAELIHHPLSPFDLSKLKRIVFTDVWLNDTAIQRFLDGRYPTISVLEFEGEAISPVDSMSAFTGLIPSHTMDNLTHFSMLYAIYPALASSRSQERILHGLSDNCKRLQYVRINLETHEVFRDPEIPIDWMMIPRLRRLDKVLEKIASGPEMESIWVWSTTTAVSGAWHSLHDCLPNTSRTGIMYVGLWQSDMDWVPFRNKYREPNNDDWDEDLNGYEYDALDFHPRPEDECQIF